MSRPAASREISIHAPRTGSDCAQVTACGIRTNFNPRSPYGERLRDVGRDIIDNQFQSTLPVRGATGGGGHCVPWPFISIHAPRTGSDSGISDGAPCDSHFNPRSPYGERPVLLENIRSVFIFQSTLPVRGATIRSLLCFADMLFQSTLPVRGATGGGGFVSRLLNISIHAPRTGSDAEAPEFKEEQRYFNPRSPYGERLVVAHLVELLHQFQSTLPVRGATRRYDVTKETAIFQSTLPVRGATRSWRISTAGARFQSTLPVRGATWYAQGVDLAGEFQSTLPVRGAT